MSCFNSLRSFKFTVSNEEEQVWIKPLPFYLRDYQRTVFFVLIMILIFYFFKGGYDFIAYVFLFNLLILVFYYLKRRKIKLVAHKVLLKKVSLEIGDGKDKIIVQKEEIQRFFVDAYLYENTGKKLAIDTSLLDEFEIKESDSNFRKRLIIGASISVETKEERFILFQIQDEDKVEDETQTVVNAVIDCLNQRYLNRL